MKKPKHTRKTLNQKTKPKTNDRKTKHETRSKDKINYKELSKIIEAILFTSGKYVSIRTLTKLTSHSAYRVKKAIEILKKKHNLNENSSLEIIEDGEFYKLTIKSHYLKYAKNMADEIELPKAVLDTLALIAWLSPVKQTRIIEARGNKAYEHIKYLKQRGFISKEREGRTYRLRLTRKFYDYFEVDHSKIKEVLNKKAKEAQIRTTKLDKDTLSKSKRKIKLQPYYDEPPENLEIIKQELKHEYFVAGEKGPVILIDESSASASPVSEGPDREKMIKESEDIEKKIEEIGKRVENIEIEKPMEGYPIGTNVGEGESEDNTTKNNAGGGTVTNLTIKDANINASGVKIISTKEQELEQERGINQDAQMTQKSFEERLADIVNEYKKRLKKDNQQGKLLKVELKEAVKGIDKEDSEHSESEPDKLDDVDEE